MNQVTNFIKEAREEFSRVTWPTREETIRLTVVVIFVSLVIGGFVGALDYLFTNVMNLLLKR